jgi:predicted DCC family thiol-disulfide oxidoreductase YuxK
MNQDNEKTIIIYDGDCPFCSRYVTLLRLKETVNNVTLMNARNSLGIFEKELKDLSIDLDEGMAVKLNNRWYHGHECINVLALLTTKSSTFNRLNSWIFKHKILCIMLYPIMRFFRNLTLTLLGRKKLDDLNQTKN